VSRVATNRSSENALLWRLVTLATSARLASWLLDDRRRRTPLVAPPDTKVSARHQRLTDPPPALLVSSLHRIRIKPDMPNIKSDMRNEMLLAGFSERSARNQQEFEYGKQKDSYLE
jgi:hypothetical protein